MRLAVVNNIVVQSPEIEIVETTAGHIRELADTLRENDKKEMEAAGNFSIMKRLWKSYKMSNLKNTALIDGKVAAIWGCGGTLLGTEGHPWLITSYEVEKISPLKFARIYKREVDKMLNIFPYLVNYVWAPYDEAVRLLMIVGFDLGEPENIGNGMFRRFSMGVKNV